MTEQEYRQHPAVSRSDLWRLKDSPEKFKFYRENPVEPTQALIFGQLFHAVVLQPEQVQEMFAVAPDCDKRTKAGREEYAAFVESAQGKTVVTLEQMAEAQKMCDAVKRHTLASKLLGGVHEKEYLWTDEITGENCKCRADIVTEVGGMPLVVDLKTTTDASTDGFTREALRYGYDFQAAMYLEGVNKVTECEHNFVIIAIEKTPPYAVNVLLAPRQFVQHGYGTFRELIEIYHDCKQSGVWYGYNGKDNMLGELLLPSWME